MGPLAAKPDESVIEQGDEFEGTLLSWPLPPSTPLRNVALPFLALWTFVWTVGLIATVHSLILDPDVALLLWIFGWTVAGGWAPIVLCASFRRRPESVLLGHDSLTYDAGWDLYSPSELAGLMAGTLPLGPRKPIVVPRSTGFVLEPVGDRHLLGFEHEGKRIEIGTHLDEPDRKWLHGILESWRRA